MPKKEEARFEKTLGLLNKELEAESFHPVYLLYGKEEYLVKEYCHKLMQAVLKDGDEMNFAFFQGKEIDFAEVRDIGSTLPFFADYRLLYFEETGLFKKANELSEILTNLPESTVVVFREKEVDKRNKLYKYVQKNGLISEMVPMGEKAMIDFIVDELWKGQKRIKKSTVDYFLSQVEHSMFHLKNEIMKLISYTGDRMEVTMEDIDAICCREASDQIFSMLDAVADGNSVRALHFYGELLILQKEPLGILAMLFRHCNILLQIKTEENNHSGYELAKRLGLFQNHFSNYSRQAKKFQVSQLKEMLERCVETDFSFKRGQINIQLGLETLLVSFSEMNSKRGNT